MLSESDFSRLHCLDQSCRQRLRLTSDSLVHWLRPRSVCFRTPPSDSEPDGRLRTFPSSFGQFRLIFFIRTVQSDYSSSVWFRKLSFIQECFVLFWTVSPKFFPLSYSGRVVELQIVLPDLGGVRLVSSKFGQIRPISNRNVQLRTFLTGFIWIHFQKGSSPGRLRTFIDIIFVRESKWRRKSVTFYSDGLF